MNHREIPDPEYDDPNELYAFFGLTFYRVQVLEQGVVNLAVALNVRGKGSVSVGDVLRLYEDYGGRTFGKVLHAVKQLTTIPHSLEADLKKALDYRNYLAHAFFVRHSEDALSEKGRHAMINELRTMLEFLV